MADIYLVYVGEREIHIQAPNGDTIEPDEFLNLFLEKGVSQEKIPFGQLITEGFYLGKSRYASNILGVAKKRGIKTYGDFLKLSDSEKEEMMLEAGYKSSGAYYPIANLHRAAYRIARKRWTD